MLKITVTHDHHGTTFALAGRLAGAWVQELRQCWLQAKAGGAAPLRLDLKETTFVDAEGKTLLSEMHRQGVAFEVHGCMMRALVESMERHNR